MTTDMPYGWRKTGETYSCSRCGKTKVKGSILLTQGLTVCRDIDLCGECLKSFKRWLKGKEEEGELE